MRGKQVNGDSKTAQQASEPSKFKSEICRQLQAFPEDGLCFPEPSSSHSSSRSTDLGAGFIQERVCLNSVWLKEQNKQEKSWECPVEVSMIVHTKLIPESEPSLI